MTREEQYEIVNLVSERLKVTIDAAVANYLQRSVKNHLEDLIKEAKDAATREIAAKLLRLALEEK